ncbi:hypothetical protein BHE97_17085 [Aeromicrobium sp. PE09-221]|nr:hypothetical protein BHE97_17085 [Aeromicrobium sp. PE09-221]
MCQALAWLEVAQPEEHRRWERRLDAADYQPDEVYDRLTRELVAQWRQHRDDPLPSHQRLNSDLAQAEDWLGREYASPWRRWHGLAMTPAEIEHDHDELLSLWRQHRDGGDDLPTGARDYLAWLKTSREERLTEAEKWFRNEDPDAYRRWDTRRSFADTVQDATRDEHDLIRRWLDEGAPAAPPAPSARQPSARHRWTDKILGRRAPGRFGRNDHAGLGRKPGAGPPWEL